jgi:PTH1 family peptidyl-tRNA hydrolase
MEKFLIAGLGNIGVEYDHTRHNIGFDVVDAFASRHGAFFSIQRLAAKTEVSLKGRKIVLIKPTTYMNLSGKSVKYWMDLEKIKLENLLVIVDELALPLQKSRLRGSGSAGGHNGLKDINASLGSEQYARLRFGIGNDYPKGKQADFVLSRWKPEEKPLIDQKIQVSVDLIESFVLQGLEKTMNLFNNMSFGL